MDDHRRRHYWPWQVAGWWCWIPLVVVAIVAAVALGPIIAEVP